MTVTTVFMVLAAPDQDRIVWQVSRGTTRPGAPYVEIGADVVTIEGSYSADDRIDYYATAQAFATSDAPAWEGLKA